MCRGTKAPCVELGPLSTWSREATRMPPRWFWDAVATLADTAHSAAEGDANAARAKPLTIREREANRWFDEHAQNACYARARVLKVSRPKSVIVGTRLAPAEKS